MVRRGRAQVVMAMRMPLCAVKRSGVDDRYMFRHIGLEAHVEDGA